jgi:hypothetical protein
MSKELFKNDEAKISFWACEDGDAKLFGQCDGVGPVSIKISPENMDSLARQWLAHSAIRDGYTKAELTAAFDKVKDKTHWKNPIDATIPVADVDITAKAKFFRSSRAEDKKVMMHVTAPGYYAGPAN